MTTPPNFITPGTILESIIIYVRRIIKSSSNQEITDAVIADYINRFYIYDLPQRLQLFELKRQYTFETEPYIFEYQFPYNLYQEIKYPVYADGVQLGYMQSNDQFYKVFPELVLNETYTQADGSTGIFSINFSQSPVIRGFWDDLNNLQPYIYITCPNQSGDQMLLVDDGYGYLWQTVSSNDFTFVNLQNIPNLPVFPYDPVLNMASTYSNGTVDYINGTASFSFNENTLSGAPIYDQCSPFSAGFPRIMNFFNNIIKLYPIPDRAYKIVMDCFVTPSQFLQTTNAVPFSYMSEYIARGAARKILSDVGDVEQFAFYEPLFKESECLVLRRSSRQNATQRTPTIYSTQNQNNPYIYTQY